MLVKHLVAVEYNLVNESWQDIELTTLTKTMIDIFNHTKLLPSGCWHYPSSKGLHYDLDRMMQANSQSDMPRCTTTIAVGKERKLVYCVSFMLYNNLFWPDPICRHLCGNGYCVNPEHLYPGDTLDNKLDDTYHNHYGRGNIAHPDWYEAGMRPYPSIAHVFEDLRGPIVWNGFWQALDETGYLEMLENKKEI